MKKTLFIVAAAALAFIVGAAYATTTQTVLKCVVGTNSTQAVTNNVSGIGDEGTFRRIVYTLPAGVTNQTIALVDFDGTSLVSTSVAGAAGNFPTNVTWTGSQIHGGFKLIVSSAFTTNSTVNFTNSLMILEDK